LTGYASLPTTAEVLTVYYKQENVAKVPGSKGSSDTMAQLDGGG